jgi:hypothetical protein
MWQRNTWVGLVAAAVVGLAPAGAAEGKKNETSLNDLSLDVAALQTLHEFKFTPSQMEKLQKMAKETAQKPRRRKPAKASDEYREAVLALRSALVEDLDDDQIDTLEEQLDGLRDSEKPELDDDVEVTRAARKRAAEVLRRLSAPQVASFIAANADDVTDPLERLREALPKVRTKKAGEWKVYREEVASEVGRLVAGLDEDKADKVSTRAEALLTRARGLTAEEFKKERPALEKEARKVVGEVLATDVLRHFAEYALAEMLSNPRLAVVLKERLK